jgi:5-(carboxyamino)imidazole ribonucleotide mutase
VATVALNGGRNAGILAAQIIGAHDEALLKRIVAFKEELKKKVLDAAKDLKS